jgi:NAD(P)-dependent dehydrogenase (short-subunit alcohol dehydrogenase family)
MHDQRHVVVTGGASGMGRAVAQTFGRLGAHVSILDNDEPGLHSLERDLAGSGISVESIACDVRSQSGVEAAFAQAERRFGSVWILAAAAGVLDGAVALDAAAPDVWERVIGINLTGVFLTNRRAAESMRQAGAGGRIVNWSSLASAIGLRGYGAYCASKAGVEALTRVLAVELGPHKITVNALVLGPVATQMIGVGPDDDRERSGLPAGRMAEPVEVAELVAFLASDACSFMTGTCLEFSGGLGAVRGSWSAEELAERLPRLHGRRVDPELLTPRQFEATERG